MKKTTTYYNSDGTKSKSSSHYDEDENIIKNDSKSKENNYSYDSNKNITEIKSVSKVDDKINYLKQKNIYDTEKRLIKQTTIDVSNIKTTIKNLILTMECSQLRSLELGIRETSRTKFVRFLFVG